MVLPAPGQLPGQRLMLLLLLLVLVPVPPPSHGMVVVVVVVVLDMGELHFLQRWVVRTVWVHILAASSPGVEGSGRRGLGWV